MKKICESARAQRQRFMLKNHVIPLKEIEVNLDIIYHTIKCLLLLLLLLSLFQGILSVRDSSFDNNHIQTMNHARSLISACTSVLLN